MNNTNEITTNEVDNFDSENAILFQDFAETEIDLDDLF